MDIIELAVVIPAFKDNQKIRHCLLSLNRGDATGFKIIVVDHGETGEITDWIALDFPKIICLRGSTNIWWTGATNLGVKHAIEIGCKYIMPLNHDCYVRENTISVIFKSFEDIQCGIVAPVQWSMRNKKKQICAGTLFLLGLPTVILPGSWCQFYRQGSVIPTGLIIGGRGALIGIDVFRKLGYFDEHSFPHYLADHDFYLRCKKSNIGLFTSTEAIVDVDDVYPGNRTGSRKHMGFIQSLVDKKSHRNLKDTRELFSRHYPIPGFALFGLGLYLIRYSIVYFLRFLSNIFRPG